MEDECQKSEHERGDRNVLDQSGPHVVSELLAPLFRGLLQVHERWGEPLVELTRDVGLVRGTIFRDYWNEPLAGSYSVKSQSQKQLSVYQTIGILAEVQQNR